MHAVRHTKAKHSAINKRSAAAGSPELRVCLSQRCPEQLPHLAAASWREVQPVIKQAAARQRDKAGRQAGREGGGEVGSKANSMPVPPILQNR
jgi:hypothetical protein